MKTFLMVAWSVVAAAGMLNGWQGRVPATPAAKGSAMDKIAEQYVKLVLAMGQHDADYVDAYYGPPEWKKLLKGIGLGKRAIFWRQLGLREARFQVGALLVKDAASFVG